MFYRWADPDNEPVITEAYGLPELRELEISCLRPIHPRFIEQLIEGQQQCQSTEPFHGKLKYLKVAENLCEDDFLDRLLAMRIFQGLSELMLANGHVREELLASLPGTTILSFLFPQVIALLCLSTNIILSFFSVLKYRPTTWLAICRLPTAQCPGYCSEANSRKA